MLSDMKYICIFVLVFSFVMLGWYLKDHAVIEPTIGGDRDEQGCLIAAGYIFTEKVGACLRQFEMTPDIEEAARLAVLAVGRSYALTVVSFNAYEEPGAYDIMFERGEERTPNTVHIRGGVVVPEEVIEKEDSIRVSAPRPGAAVASPVVVSGMARGTWFFEATFPIIIVDWDGRIIGEGYVSATDDWMTEEFVPFTGEVSFDLPIGTPYKRGAIIFKKDNPSDLPEYDDALEIPLVFE